MLPTKADRKVDELCGPFQGKTIRVFHTPSSPALFLVAALLLGTSVGAAGGGDVLAEVEGEAITAQAAEAALAAQLANLEEQIYKLKLEKLEEMIAETLLRQEAKKRGISIQELLGVEVASKVARLTEQEVDNFYQQRKAGLRGPEKEVRERIRSELNAQRAAAQKEAFVRQLRAERRVVVHLQRPAPIRVAVDGREGAALKGFPMAPVLIVEFSNFQCPYCRKALNELEKVRAAYPKEVKLVYRHFPIDRLHPLARLAAQAAECAGAEGHFWEYHDLLFSQADLSEQKLKELALGLKLGLQAFEQCLSGEWARARVAQDVEAGARAGVSGTPTFFINGRLVVGAQSFDVFKRIIEEELAMYRRQSLRTN